MENENMREVRRLSDGFYREVYKQIMDYGFVPKHEDDEYRFMEFDCCDIYYVKVIARFEVITVDDSFSHAFGVQRECHYKTGKLIDVNAVEVWATLFNGDAIDVSDCFDYDNFYEKYLR